jgi:hypothetical protein
MGKSTINGHFQKQIVKLPEGNPRPPPAHSCSTTHPPAVAGDSVGSSVGRRDCGPDNTRRDSSTSVNKGNSRGIHWIGLRENLQETMVFTIKYRAFL